MFLKDSDVQERRYYTRYSLEVMNIHGEIPFATNVKILNISLSGIFIETDKRPDIGNKYVLKLEHEGRELTLQGIVIRSNLKRSLKDSEGKTVLKYTSGIHFINVSDKKLIEIAKFIKENIVDNRNQTLQFNDIYLRDGLRLYVRFLIEDLKKVSLHIRQGYYHVTNISLGGIQIESEHEMETDEILLTEINLPEDKVISFLGKIKACNLSENIDSGLYEIALEFIDISEQDQETLLGFISSMKNTDSVQTR